MLELFGASVIITGLLIVAGLRFRDTGEVSVHSRRWYDTYRGPTELPCPWCGAETQEQDTACPSCHHPFGPADANVSRGEVVWH